ncbi:FGGY family carbohydrate kinase [Solicola gregarius]|uniref:FGGY family carbohydrate kinase n=1 Tax=Solicola gregarius TaxID=2908642 RepID=A0AA46THR6_9ACTN|nr:FGGY family carbohydrate kinase [Solicola gregarius]UYM04748.1 FGGY family carbohydrate kinase [Solicola gregarius]
MSYAGVDVGTSGLKLAVLDDDGEVAVERAVGYDVVEPHPGWCEIDPYDWLRAYAAVSGDIGGVTGLGVTGQMHGVVLTDGDAEPVRPAVLWLDERASVVAAEWARTGVLDALGTPIVPGYAGAILAWLGEHEPATMARAERVWFAKDWVRARLCGDAMPVTDRSDAAGSLLWDPATEEWSAAAAEVVGIDRAQLPEVRPSDEIVGQTAGAAVVVGAADTATALLAYRAMAPDAGPDTVYVNVGTGCQVLRADAAWHRPAYETERVFADAGSAWYTMHAFDTRSMPSADALVDAIARAVSRLEGVRVVAGGGKARDPAFRRLLARRLGLPLAYAPLRSPSACGAAILAAHPNAPRIGLRRGAVEVMPTGPGGSAR